MKAWLLGYLTYETLSDTKKNDSYLGISIYLSNNSVMPDPSPTNFK